MVWRNSVIDSNYAMQSGADAFTLINSMAVPPTAVLCWDDMSAFGLMCSAAEHGVKIPQDLSVVGFDDLTFAEFSTPKLTTIRLSQDGIGQRLFKSLKRKVENEAVMLARDNEPIATHLILRKSTAIAKSALKN